MHAPEAINSSLATLYFAYNIHFTDFFKDHEIFQKFISQTQTFDLQIKGIEDIRILTENSLVAAFRTHSITLDEALIKHFKLTNRTGHKNDPLIYPIRKFLHELRCGNAHMRKTLHKLTWDIGEKTPKPKFFFDIYLPYIGDNTIPRYDPQSSHQRKISFQGTPGRAISITQKFIHKIIFLTFHIIKIVSFRKKHTCDQFLTRCKSHWATKKMPSI